MDRQIKSVDEIYKLLHITVMVGRIILQSGGEVFRVEDTIERMCSSFTNLDGYEVLAMKTSVSVTLIYEGIPYNSVAREKSPSYKLEVVDMMNAFSRNFINTGMDLNQAYRVVMKIDRVKDYPNWFLGFCTGIIGALFTLLYGGPTVDFVPAFFVGFITYYIVNKSAVFFVPEFMVQLLAGFLTAGIAAVFSSIGFATDPNMIIIGCLMPYVPGMAITNAVRDILSGDYMTGLMTIAQAIFIAVGLAFGVGMVLAIYL
ncbi:MAG: threonine/serine exporter family protein [Bacillota bacterium]|nr:threonine/serine exporter family protein [Bacillota bacterium]